MFNLLGFLRTFSVAGKRRKAPERQLYLGIAICGCLGILLIIFSRNYLHDKNPVPDAIVYFTAPIADNDPDFSTQKLHAAEVSPYLSEQVISGQMAIRLKKEGAADGVRVVINKGDYSGWILPQKFTYSTELASKGRINISFSLVYESRIAFHGKTGASMNGSTIDYTFFNTIGMNEMDIKLEEGIKEIIHRKLDMEIAIRIERLRNKETQPGIVSTEEGI